MKSIGNVIQSALCESWMYPDADGSFHYLIRLVKLADDPMWDAAKSWLA